MRSLIAIALVLATASAAFAQATTMPAASAPAEGALTVTAVEVVGNCQKMQAGQSVWSPLVNGDRLDELAVIRTGMGSGLKLQFADNSTVEVGACTKLGIRQFRKQGQTTATAIGLKYGTLRADVEKAKGPNDFRVATPVAVLSVRGSRADVGFAGDRGLNVDAARGSWNLANSGGSIDIGAGERSNGDLEHSGDLLLADTHTQLGPIGLDHNELNSLLHNGDGRGIFGFTGPNTDPNSEVGRDPSEIDQGSVIGGGDVYYPGYPGYPGYGGYAYGSATGTTAP